jgi:large subunit ribosomal protein L11
MDDRTYKITYKTPPASFLILKALNIKSGSGKNLIKKVGTLTKDQVKEIAEIKMPDLNAHDIEAAMKIIEGTAQSMGVEVK